MLVMLCYFNLNPLFIFGLMLLDMLSILSTGYHPFVYFLIKLLLNLFLVLNLISQTSKLLVAWLLLTLWIQAELSSIKGLPSAFSLVTRLVQKVIFSLIFILIPFLFQEMWFSMRKFFLLPLTTLIMELSMVFLLICLILIPLLMLIFLLKLKIFINIYLIKIM